MADQQPIRFNFPKLSEALEFFRDGPLFRLFVERGGTQTVVAGADFPAPRAEQTPDEVKYVFENAGDLRVTLTFRQRDAEVTGDIHVENSGRDTVVSRVQFPCIAYPRVKCQAQRIKSVQKSSWKRLAVEAFSRASERLSMGCQARLSKARIFHYQSVKK